MSTEKLRDAFVNAENEASENVHLAGRSRILQEIVLLRRLGSRAVYLMGCLAEREKVKQRTVTEKFAVELEFNNARKLLDDAISKIGKFY